MLWHIFSLFASLVLVASEPRNAQTFDLPNLILHSNSTYLQKNIPTEIKCQIAPGWSEATLVNVTWVKDGTPMSSIENKDDYGELAHKLIIYGTKQTNEGNYQCLTYIRDIRLSNREYVHTWLISPSIKLRRARITKFDKTTEHYIDVRQGEVARLPCVGMPDVIPGPPAICFEKEGLPGRCLGGKDDHDKKYLPTVSGLQISLAQPSDNGRYFCVARNTFNNVTRKSEKAVHLQVDAFVKSDEKKPFTEMVPNVVFPPKKNKPIVVDAVAGEEVILECVFASARVVWRKHNDTQPPISLTVDDDQPFTQIWGNLRILKVSQHDAGTYSCYGLNPLDPDANIDTGNHPNATYRLIVHAPTFVEFNVTQNEIARSWQLSCAAMNVDYEVPLVYVNGTPLIDSIDEMGIPITTNFYTNPLNVTMELKQTFSGSVQCLSLPAMEEAEVYGIGMERGRSKNTYVISSSQQNDNLITQGPTNTTAAIGTAVELICLIKKTSSKYWRRRAHNETNWTYVRIIDYKARIVGAHTLRIDNVQLHDSGWYMCCATDEHGHEHNASAYLHVTEPTTTSTPEPELNPKREENVTIINVREMVSGRQVRVMWEIDGNETAKAKLGSFIVDVRQMNGEWIQATSVGGHVRATTIPNLIPDLAYQFRVKAVRDDGLVMNIAEGKVVKIDHMPIPPDAPKIVSLEPISSTTMRLLWNYTTLYKIAFPKSFTIVLTEKDADQSTVKRVGSNVTELVLSELKPLTDYAVTLTARNEAGNSPASNSISATTLDASMENGLFDVLWGGVKQVYPDLNLTTVVVVLSAVLIALIAVVICCLVLCNYRTRVEKASKSANGKFLDTSYRIFNEQKVHKSKQNNNATLFNTDDIDECSPLRMPGLDRGSMNGDPGFNLRTTMPSLYGQVGEEIEEDHADPPNDPNYVNAPPKISSQGIYGTTTARCYSPDSGTSHEMLMHPFSSTPAGFPSPPSMGGIVNAPIVASSPQRVIAYKCPDSLLYSPAGTASSSLGDNSSSGQQTRLTCDSPTNPPTDSSDQGIRCGGSSRNSQISSTDGNGRFLHTFKPPPSQTSTFMGTFQRPKEQLPMPPIQSIYDMQPE